MQAIMETIFETGYLAFALVSGFFLIAKSKGKLEYIVLTIAILLLGIGDAFHLIPRMIALNTDGLLNHQTALGVELVFSIARGYAEYTKGDHYKDVLQKADKAMYDNKTQVKQKYNMAER